SDYMEQLPAGWGGSNYRCNFGTNLLNGFGPLNGDPSGVNSLLAPPNSGFFVNSKYKAADIRNGQSNPACFSEHIKGDFSDAIPTPVPDTYKPGTHPENSHQAGVDGQGRDINSLSTQLNSSGGGPWLKSGHPPKRYSHSFPPGGRSCAYPPNRIVTTANSAHNQGVNVVMFDG